MDAHVRVSQHILSKIHVNSVVFAAITNLSKSFLSFKSRSSSALWTGHVELQQKSHRFYRKIRLKLKIHNNRKVNWGEISNGIGKRIVKQSGRQQLLTKRSKQYRWKWWNEQLLINDYFYYFIWQINCRILSVKNSFE
jgi:hypothetical protein